MAERVDSREAWRSGLPGSPSDRSAGTRLDSGPMGSASLTRGSTTLAALPAGNVVLHVGDRLPHPAGLEMPPLLFWGVVAAVVLLAGWLVVDLLPASGRRARTGALHGTVGDDAPDPGEPLIVGRGRGRSSPLPAPRPANPETAIAANDPVLRAPSQPDNSLTEEAAQFDPVGDPPLRRHDDVSLVSRDLVIAAGETREWQPPPDTFLTITGAVTTLRRDAATGTVSASVAPGDAEGRLVAWSIARSRSRPWTDPARLLPAVAGGAMGLLAAERTREVQGLASLVRSDNAAQVSRLALGFTVLLLVGAALAIPVPRAAAAVLALAGLVATTLAFAPQLANRLRWWDARYVLGEWPHLGWWAVAAFTLAGVALLGSHRRRGRAT